MGGGEETPRAGHLKGSLCGQQGRLVRGQLASSVRGRWNSAGTSGREQRASQGEGANGHRGQGQGKGVARTLCVNSQLWWAALPWGRPWLGAGDSSL